MYVGKNRICCKINILLKNLRISSEFFSIQTINWMWLWFTTQNAHMIKKKKPIGDDDGPLIIVYFSV